MKLKTNNLNLIALSFLLIFSLWSFSAVSAETNEGTQKYNNILFKSELDPNDGSEVLIREAYFPVGWNAPRHYHNGNLFIYVIEGEFEVDMDGTEKTVYIAGDALQMEAHTNMDARNPSLTKALKLAVFQVGKPDAAFVVPVE